MFLECRHSVRLTCFPGAEIDSTVAVCCLIPSTVPSGEYRLSAFTATPENAPELLLSPYFDVKINSPTLNTNFYQAQVNVHGSVMCKERCGLSIFVKLVKLDGKGKEKAKTSSLTAQSNEFIFLNVLPRKYKIE